MLGSIDGSNQTEDNRTNGCKVKRGMFVSLSNDFVNSSSKQIKNIATVYNNYFTPASFKSICPATFISYCLFRGAALLKYNFVLWTSCMVGGAPFVKDFSNHKS